MYIPDSSSLTPRLNLRFQRTTPVYWSIHLLCRWVEGTRSLHFSGRGGKSLQTTPTYPGQRQERIGTGLVEIGKVCVLEQFARFHQEDA
jgi:hypothetical protein